MSSTIKLQDTSPIVGRQSRLEQYWLSNGFADFFNRFRNGKKIPVSFKTISRLDEIVKTYHLRAIGFGNWVTQEDRYNYVMAMFMAFYDLDKVLQFKKNIGLNGTVSISFGARGKGRAIAHFEPGTFIINMTRYKDKEVGGSKPYRFLATGGAGALAHEYGHALDWYFGAYRDLSIDSQSLSGGGSVAMTMEQNGRSLRKGMDAVMNAIIWKVPGKTPSAYYTRMKEKHGTPYILSRCEIFARAFEKYVQFKLARMGIKNMFLTDTKYDPAVYMTDTEMANVVPLMDRLLTDMRKVL